jgi:hypothetical protein
MEARPAPPFVGLVLFIARSSSINPPLEDRAQRIRHSRPPLPEMRLEDKLPINGLKTKKIVRSYSLLLVPDIDATIT